MQGREGGKENKSFDIRGMEDRVGRVFEHQAQRMAEIRPETFLWAAGASIVGSAMLHLLSVRRHSLMSELFGMRTGSHQAANVIGLLAPAFLIAGIYRSRMTSSSQHTRW